MHKIALFKSVLKLCLKMISIAKLLRGLLQEQNTKKIAFGKLHAIASILPIELKHKAGFGHDPAITFNLFTGMVETECSMLPAH